MRGKAQGADVGDKLQRIVALVGPERPAAMRWRQERKHFQGGVPLRVVVGGAHVRLHDQAVPILRGRLA